MIDRDDIDGNAAEYVLGTLDYEERTELDHLRVSDPAVDAAIWAWEMRLAPLLDAVPEVKPAPDLFASIANRLPLRPSALNQARALQRWRTLAVAASLAFVIVSGIALNVLKTQTIASPAVTLLQANPGAPAYLVSLDEKNAILTVNPLAAIAPSDKDYELWLIAPGASAPRSLGVLPRHTSRSIKLTEENASGILGATLAVSTEPIGGSPTGAPTGQVILSGKFL